MAYTYIPDEYGGPPHLRFETPQDFVQYVRDLDAGKYPGQSATPATREQAQKIQSDPKQWTIENGHPKLLGGWLDRNLKTVIPAVAGGIAAPFVIPALVGGGAAAGGASAAGTVPGTTIAGGAGQVPAWAGGAAAAAGSGAGYVPGTTIAEGAGQVPRPPSGALDMLKNTVPGALTAAGEGLSPILRAAIGALAGIGPALMAGRGNEPSAEENALMAQALRMQKLQEGRIEYQDPMFRAVTQLANSRLPTAYQAKLGER